MKFEKTALRFKEALNICGLSQQELANKSGIGKSSISHYVNGSNEPGNKAAYALAKVLNVNPAWLMGLDVPMTLPEPAAGGSDQPAAPSVAPVQLRKDEADLLSDYNKLNSLGKSKVADYAADLTENERYIKEDTFGGLNKVG